MPLFLESTLGIHEASSEFKATANNAFRICAQPELDASFRFAHALGP